MSSVFTTNNNNLNLLTKTSIPINTINSAIIYNGSYYLVGGNAVIFSVDSSTWSSTPISISGMTTIKNFAWNNPSNGIPKIQPLTIACGEGTNTLAYSQDGIYWRGLGKNIFSTRANKAVWNGVLWVAVGSGGCCIATSYDGILWTGRNSILFDEGYDVAWNGNMFIAVGTKPFEAASSTDGITWNNISSLSQLFSDVINSIQWTGKIWLATGSGGNTTAYSNDGFVWQPTNSKNLIITDASNVFSNSNAASSVTASSISPTFLATFVSDNSMNPTSSTEWRSNINLYNASTGLYTGTTITTYNNNLTASGEWLQIDAQTPLRIVYYHLSWYTDVSSSFFTIPDEWFLLGSSTGTGNWNLIEYFNYNSTTPPVNITSNRFVVKLQNIYSNNIAYQYYRFVFPSLFPGGTLTYARVSELDLFYENVNSTTINRYIKPIVTPTHILYQTNIIPFSANTGKRVVYQVTDLCGNIVPNNIINNGSIYNSIINGAPNTNITSGCFDGENYVITPMTGNICYMNTQSLNTNFNFDISVNNNVINRNISGNVFSSCFNGQRIILGGTGGNVITYSPIISKNPNGSFANSLNANSLFTSVYGVASNSGYGPVYIPNRLYLNTGDKLSIVGPKSYNKSISSSTTISMNLNNYVPQTNIDIPISTIVYGSIGPIGNEGIQGSIGTIVNGPVGFIGSIGFNSISEGSQGIDGSTGSTGSTGFTGSIGIDGFQGTRGDIGILGSNGVNGLDGVQGTIGPTGPNVKGSVDEKLWNIGTNNTNTYSNIFISSTNTTPLFDNALNINGDFKTNNNINANNIQSNISIINKKFIAGKTINKVIPNANIVCDVSGDININNYVRINNPPFSNSYSLDVSGIVYARKLLINNSVITYLVPTNITSNTISIDFNKSMVFYVDVGTTITSNFTCIFNNFNFYGNSTVIRIKLILDYTNALLNRYFCDKVNRNGTIYNIIYKEGDPSVLFSNSIATNNYIQNITILLSGGNIWKVMCDSVFYSS